MNSLKCQLFDLKNSASTFEHFVGLVFSDPKTTADVGGHQKILRKVFEKVVKNKSEL